MKALSEFDTIATSTTDLETGAVTDGVAYVIESAQDIDDLFALFMDGEDDADDISDVVSIDNYRDDY